METQKSEFQEGSPVKYREGDRQIDFPIRFRWHTGIWFSLFEKNVALIVREMERARATGHLIIYLSCPITARNGGVTKTNVEISEYIARSLINKWGQKFWILNPAMYQMESKIGTGLIKEHAYLLSLEKSPEKPIDVDELSRANPVIGGDYLRMWSRVLIEDGAHNLGGRIDAFYFVGPTDIHDFFIGSNNSKDISTAIKSYLASEMAIDSEFRDYFANSGNFEDLASKFFKYYSIMAGANFSMGSRDEYEIWRKLNLIRSRTGGPSFLIPGYFDGRQIGFDAVPMESASRGYAL